MMETSLPTMGKRGNRMNHDTNEQINLSDFALFLSVMKVKAAYEDVLSIILDEPNLKLKEVKVEQVILNKSGKRAIRLDAWALDEYDRQFDMEMQNDTEKDHRILDLDKIVREVKQSEEWEVERMSILEIGLERGIAQGIAQGMEQGRLRTMIRSVELNIKKYHVTLREACEGLEISVEEYEDAKRQIACWDEESTNQ